MKRGERVVAERAANLADENLDVVGMDVGIGPDRLEQSVFGHHVPGAVDEQRQQVERLVRERTRTWSRHSVRPAGSSLKGAKYFTFSTSIVTESGRHGDPVRGVDGAKSYRNPTVASDGWRSYRAPTVIQPLWPRLFVEEWHFVRPALSPRRSAAGPRLLSSLPARLWARRTFPACCGRVLSMMRVS